MEDDDDTEFEYGEDVKIDDDYITSVRYRWLFDQSSINQEDIDYFLTTLENMNERDFDHAFSLFLELQSIMESNSFEKTWDTIDIDTYRELDWGQALLTIYEGNTDLLTRDALRFKRLKYRLKYPNYSNWKNRNVPLNLQPSIKRFQEKTALQRKKLLETDWSTTASFVSDFHNIFEIEKLDRKQTLFPKLPVPPNPQSAQKYEEKLKLLSHSITSGQWGINFANRTICTLKDPVCIYTLTQNYGNGSYFVIQYVFVNFLDPGKFTNYFNSIRQIFTRSEECNPFLYVYKALLRAKSAYDAGKVDKSYDYNALDESLTLLNSPLENKADLALAADKWTSFLVYSHGSSPTDLCKNYSVLSTMVGYIQEKAMMHQKGYLETELSLPVAYCAFVGNTEMASKTGESLPGFEYRNKMPAGACTILMSMTFQMLKRLGFGICYLINAGKIAGCKCYASSGAVNNYSILTGARPSDIVSNIINGGILSGVYEIDELSCESVDKKEKDSTTMVFIEKSVLYKLQKFRETYTTPQTKGTMRGFFDLPENDVVTVIREESKMDES